MKFLNMIVRRSDWRPILATLVGSAVLAVCILTKLFGHLSFDADATMDAAGFYTAEVFFANLDLLGRDGRRAYVVLHLFDYLFIAQFYPLLILLTGRLLQALQGPRLLNALVAIPMLSGFSDVMENLLVDFSILLYPRQIAVMGSAAGLFTWTKFQSINLTFAAIVILTISWIIRRISRSRGEKPPAQLKAVTSKKNDASEE